MNQILYTILNARKPPKEIKYLASLEATLFMMNHSALKIIKIIMDISVKPK